MKTRFTTGQSVRVRKELELGRYGNYNCVQDVVHEMLAHKGKVTTIEDLDPEGHSHTLKDMYWLWHDLFLEPVE